MSKVELLCPAGNMEAFEAALYNGADAIFLAGQSYGARASAANFSLDEIKKCVQLAHLYDVKIHITLNTLIHDRELNDCIAYIQKLSDIGVDAIIVQDLGIMDILRHYFPNIEIHASTQMHIHNLDGVKQCKKWKLNRCVVARETPLSLVKEMCNQKIEVETFVQGAYCVSYSGECHMSRNNGGRSANRGECAQSCRMPYTLYRKNKSLEEKVQTNGEYILSLKDLNAIDLVPQLIESGVSSFKIEGRMKRSEYVACMCRIYRQAIDAYYENKPFKTNETILNEMKKVFNRGFTSGYLDNQSGMSITSSYRPNHQGIKIGKVVGFHHDKMVIELQGELNQHDGIRILNKKCDQGFIVNYLYKDGKLVNHAENERIELSKMNVAVGDIVMKTSDYKQLKELSILPSRKVDIQMKATAHVGKPFILTLMDSKHEITIESQQCVEEAKTVALDEKRIAQQLTKLGNTPFVCEKCTVECDENSSFPISLVNQIRRDGVEALIEKRMNHSYCEKQTTEMKYSTVTQTHRLSVNIMDEKQYQGIKDYPVDIYVENKSLYEKIKNEREHLYRNYPRVNQEGYEEKGLIHDVGGLHISGNVASSYMNCVNAYSANVLFNSGIKCVGLSYECNDQEIEELICNYERLAHHSGNFEIEVYGRIENMVLENCLIMSQLNRKKHCQECHTKEYYLKDVKNKSYRLMGDDNCRLKVYHHECFDNLDKIKDYQRMGITNFRINLTFEDANDSEKLIKKALNAM